MKMPANETISDAEFDRRWMDDLLERLAPAEVSVPRRYSIHTFPHRQFPRECFARACYYVELHRIKRIHYVLGTAVCGGLQQHGWVEVGDIVFDAVLQRFYDKGKYYDGEHAMPWYKFTRSAVLWIVEQRFETWRWDWHLGLPWAKSAHFRKVLFAECRRMDRQPLLLQPAKSW